MKTLELPGGKVIRTTSIRFGGTEYVGFAPLDWALICKKIWTINILKLFLRLVGSKVAPEEFKELLRRLDFVPGKTGKGTGVKTIDLGLSSCPPGSPEVPLDTMRMVRRLKNLNQDEVASRAGLSQSQYNKIERGRTNTSIRKIARIGNALGVRFFIGPN